ncbi:hypothetical protein BGX23_012317 [Mortierella sp. AD031]|nr:hypothetical protein BGX23_012317 [Mortierella sp. AD031]KAG0199696.1 hypothetical protein BGX33_011487 [Mortierella sp. NVP41]
MKFAVAVASLALAASVSVQAVGSVDPAKLPTGWCLSYKGACQDSTIETACGANSTFTTSCVSTFDDKVCTSFSVSCACTPNAGGEQKDVSAEAFNQTFVDMPYGMCGNLLFSKNTTGPGIVSGDYKPDGKRPAANGTATTTGGAATNTSSSTVTPTTTGTPAGGKSAASALQMALPTIALVAITMGMAMTSL